MSEGAPLVGVGADLTQQELEAAMVPADAATEPAAAPEPAAPPPAPAIIYISEEVVQPI